MSYLSPSQLRSVTDSIFSQYDYLTDIKAKLENEVSKLRSSIEEQISMVVALKNDFVSLNTEGSFRKDDIASPPSSNSKEMQDQSESDQEGDVIETSNDINKPLIINLDAEIVDTSVITSTAFSPDGKVLAIGSKRTIRVYNINTDQFDFEYSISDETENNVHIRSIAWTRNGTVLLCGGEDHVLYAFDVKNKALLKSFKASEGEVYQVQSSKQGSFFAAVTGDGKLTAWNSADFSLMFRISRDSSSQMIAASLSISEDDKYIAVGYTDQHISLVDVKLQKTVFETPAHTKGVFAVKFLSGINMLASASLDNSIIVWDIVFNNDTVSLKERYTLNEHKDFVLSIDYDPKRMILLSGSKDTTARITSIEQGEMQYMIKGHTNAIISVSFNPHLDMFCTGSGDKSVKLWSYASEE